jgi:hypothetical protein
VYDERVLADFAWTCPNGHEFATAMPDLELHTWRRAAAPRPWRPASDA